MSKKDDNRKNAQLNPDLELSSKYAVALGYKAEENRAPIVLAKGQGQVAEKIIQIAIDNDIEIRQDEDLLQILKAVDINEEIPIDRSSEAFRLITRIQDEAHRFAIEYHRQLRGKGQVHSILDDIEGIGPTRRKALMRQYLSLEDIKKASVEELAKIPSMNEKAAESVYKFFH